MSIYMFNIIYNDTMPVPRFALYTVFNNKKYYVILAKSNSGVDGEVIRGLGVLSYASLFSINDSIYDPDLVLTTVLDGETYFLYTGGSTFMLLKAEPKNISYVKSDNVSLDNVKENLSFQNKIVTKSRYYDTDRQVRNFYAELIR